MTEYAGSALYLQWIHAAGTAVLSADFRTFSTSPSVDLYESTAGQDTDKTYISGVKDRTMSVGLVAQADGTVLTDSLVEGANGTLIVSPEGTASGKPRETYPAISQGVSRNQPYNNVVEYSVSLQGNGAVTRDNH